MDNFDVENQMKNKEIFNKIKLALEKDSNVKLHMSLADMYYYGIGTEQNLDLAKKYYQEAIERNETGISIVKELSDKYISDANEYFVLRNILGAINSYKESLKYGSIKATVILGDMFYFGFCVAEDKEIAFDYYEKAVKQGMLDQEYKPYFDKGETIKAINKLGYMYEYGLGVDENNEEAIKWYKIGVSFGSKEAIEGFDRLNNQKKI